MASKFEMNTLTEIAVLNVAVNRILTHLALPAGSFSPLNARGLKSLANNT
jgi:hypothetical protein